MRVMLISPNQELLPDPVSPLGLAYLAAALREAGHEVSILDLCFSPDIEASLGEGLQEFLPEVIGLSIRNVDNTAYPSTVSYIDPLRRVVDLLRRLSGAPILVGGSGFTIMPKEMLTLLSLEMGIIGEGERSMVQFLAQGMKDGVPGLIRRRGGRFRTMAPLPSLSMDGLPLPARDLLDVKAYLREGGVCNIQSKRGCAFRCIYCTYPLIEGRRVRLRDPKKVVAEMQGLQEGHGINHFFFVDNVFNYPPHHAEAICEEIVGRGLRIQWACYAHPGYLSPALADLMARSGCESIEFGTDSGSPAVLSALKKEFGPEEIWEASSACRQAGIPFCHSLILGGPEEDRSTLEETFGLMAKTDPTAVIAMIGVRVYPQTALAQMLVKDGYLSLKEIAYPPKFYLSETLGDEVIDLVVDHAQKSRNWIVPGRSINYSVRLQRLLRKKGKMGPTWGYMRYRRGRGQSPGVQGEGEDGGKG
jgi:radical SAM superfamily enzyme YgiQ (UPF0313 family)